MTITQFLNKVDAYILNPLILLMFAVSTVYFLYGIVKFLSTDATEKPRQEARSAILWGLVGMVIMFSVYGIIHFVMATFGISSNEGSLETAKPFLNL